MEFSSLLVTKNYYIFKFVSKDPYRGHLRQSHPSRLVHPISWSCNPSKLASSKLAIVAFAPLLEIFLMITYVVFAQGLLEYNRDEHAIHSGAQSSIFHELFQQLIYMYLSSTQCFASIWPRVAWRGDEMDKTGSSQMSKRQIFETIPRIYHFFVQNAKKLPRASPKKPKTGPVHLNL